jgi:small GTP-binding protein
MSKEVGEFKVVLIGATSVGKTCIVKRGTSGFFDSSTMPTLGASYTSKLVTVDDSIVRLLIWDTAGQERYRGITPMYYRNASATLIVYSIADRDSFGEVHSWLRTVRDNLQTKVLLFLVGNKSDLEDSRAIAIDEGQDKAAEMGAAFAEVSAKDGSGIDELFVMVATACVEQGAIKNDGKQQATTVCLPKVGGRSGGTCC